MHSGGITLANADNATTFNQTSAVNWTSGRMLPAETASGTYPAPGIGATHIKCRYWEELTLNVNIGDCVIISVSSDSSSVSGGVTDNGSGGGNTYTQIGSVLTAWGYQEPLVLLVGN